MPCVYLHWQRLAKDGFWEGCRTSALVKTRERGAAPADDLVGDAAHAFEAEPMLAVAQAGAEFDWRDVVVAARALDQRSRLHRPCCRGSRGWWCGRRSRTAKLRRSSCCISSVPPPAELGQDRPLMLAPNCLQAQRLRELATWRCPEPPRRSQQHTPRCNHKQSLRRIPYIILW